MILFIKLIKKYFMKILIYMLYGNKVESIVMKFTQNI